MKSLENEVSSLATGQEQILKEMQEMFSAMNARFNQIFSSRARGQGECSYSAVRNSGGKRNTSRGCSQESVFNSYLPRTVKLDFLRFNGTEDPASWVCRAEQFFELHQTLDDEKVILASFNIEGDAQLWFQLMKEETHFIT